MKIAFVSDLHAALRLPMAKLDPGGTSSDRLRDVLNVFAQMREHAEQKKFGAVVVVGDLFDSGKPDGPTLIHTAGALRRLADVCRVYLLPGNHDAVDRDGKMYTLQMFGELNVEGIVVLGHGGWEIDSGVILHGVPWLPEERVMKRVRARASDVDNTGHNILLMHQAFQGALWDSGVVSTEGIDPSDVEAEFDWTAVISGHYHRPQRFGNIGNYCGSPLDLRFGDEAVEQRGYRLLDLGGSVACEEFVPLKYPRFRTVEATTHTLEMTVQDAFAAGGVKYLRAITSGSRAELDAVSGLVDELVLTCAVEGIHLRVERRAIDQVATRMKLNADVNTRFEPHRLADDYVNDRAEELTTAGVDAELLRKKGREFLDAVEDR